MKFVISRKELMRGAKSVLAAVGTRSTLPVLGGMRVTAARSRITLEGTDLESFAHRIISEGISVETTGSCVTAAKPVVKALSSATGDDIEVELVEDDAGRRLAVRSGMRTMQLECLPIEDFPSSPQRLNARLAMVRAGELTDVFARAQMCASQDPARPVLTSVCLRFKDETVTVVTTDSYRMGVLDLPITERSKRDATILVPGQVVKKLAKLLRGRRDMVEIAIDGDKPTAVTFSTADLWWHTRLIDGEFPNWQQLVPKEAGAALEFDAKEMSSALKAADAVGNGSGTPIRLSLGDTTTLTLSVSDQTAVTEQLSSATFTPDGVGALEVAFNRAYLADGLKFVGDDRPRMWLRDGLKPALLGAGDRRYVLMPVRLS